MFFNTGSEYVAITTFIYKHVVTAHAFAKTTAFRIWETKMKSPAIFVQAITYHFLRCIVPMAFKKHNATIGRSSADVSSSEFVVNAHSPGVRPSLLTSQPITSTGSSSLDSLLGGHGGLALGSSLLIGESGTTDFAGALLKYYAAEGICHGHTIHIVGVGNGWVRELPGVAERGGSTRRGAPIENKEKMKIAWRYERLGQAGERGAWQSVAYIFRSV